MVASEGQRGKSIPADLQKVEEWEEERKGERERWEKRQTAQIKNTDFTEERKIKHK